MSKSTVPAHRTEIHHRLKNIDIYYQNVRGLNTKLIEVLTSSISMEHDIFAFTETWLCSNVNDREIFDTNYFNVFRADRNFSETSRTRGGGVLIATRKNLNAVQIDICTINDDFCKLKNFDI